MLEKGRRKRGAKQRRTRIWLGKKEVPHFLVVVTVVWYEKEVRAEQQRRPITRSRLDIIKKRPMAKAVDIRAYSDKPATSLSRFDNESKLLSSQFLYYSITEVGQRCSACDLPVRSAASAKSMFQYFLYCASVDYYWTVVFFLTARYTLIGNEAIVLSDEVMRIHRMNRAGHRSDAKVVN